MTKTPITLQDLRRRLYVKAKAEPSWRFWGLYSHVCTRETLRAAYQLAKQNVGFDLDFDCHRGAGERHGSKGGVL